jgi:hypothetical protein
VARVPAGDVRSALEDSFNRLLDLVQGQCEQEQTPTETTPPPATTETVPEQTQTETVPQQTETEKKPKKQENNGNGGGAGDTTDQSGGATAPDGTLTPEIQR